MHNEIQKTARIVDEIVSLFLKKGSNDIDIKIKRKIDYTHIILTINNSSISDDAVDRLDEFLNIQRQSEIEEYYWELMGETSNEDELFLIGSMVDSATVKKNDNTLYIELIRKIKK